jgi:hypothetical protein
VMVGDVFQTIAVLAVIEAVVFNAPASLTEAEQVLPITKERIFLDTRRLTTFGLDSTSAT